MGLTNKQLEFFKAFVSGEYEFMLYGGGVGGGKTFLVLGILDELCQKFPGTRYAVVRKSLTAIRKTTLPSFRKIIDINGPRDRCKLHKGDWTYYYSNGSEILFIEADVSTDPNLYKIRGLELTGAVMEEGNECEEDVFNVLTTRTGRWYNKEYGIKKFTMITCNPSDNWVKYMFYDQWSIGALKAPFYFLQALPKDNEHLDEDYVKSLEYLTGADYKRYVEGDWNYSRDPNQLIPFAHYKECIRRDANDGDEGLVGVPKYLGIDVAREGDDYSTLVFFSDNALLWVERFKFDTCVPLKEVVKQRKAQHHLFDHNMMVDGIGLGASLIDLCAQDGIYLEVFKSSETAYADEVGLDTYTFANKRACACWAYREAFYNEEITVPNDYELQKQTASIRYLEAERNIKIESKQAIKKRLGYSPDVFEGAVIGNYVRKRNLMSYGLVSKREIGKIESVSRANEALTAIYGKHANLTLTAREMVY